MKNLIIYFNISVVLILLTASILFAQTGFIEHPITSDLNEPWSIHPIDMDGDLDIDIVASARLGNQLAWWENDSNQGFSKHTISNNSYYAMGVYAIDIDEDNDVDVFCASQTNGVELWVNQGNLTFVRQIIGSWPYASFLYGEDVDSDGDEDIIVSCCEGGSNRMGWIENLDSLHFANHLVISNWPQANSAYAFDINRDGYMDLLGTSSGRETGTGEIAWFENDSNQVFTKHSIYTTPYRPSCAIALDLDLDQDVDIVALVCVINQIIWFENTGNEVFVPNPRGYGFSRALSVDTADFDNDGDIDILTGSINTDKISWLENDGTQNFTERTLTTSFDGAADVFSVDFDRDGDTDILATAQYADKLKWWENQTISSVKENINSFPSKFILMQNYPNPFNPTTTINFQIPKLSFVKLSVFDILGNEIEVLVKDEMQKGSYKVDFNSTGLASGIYLYRLEAGNYVRSHKMVLIK